VQDKRNRKAVKEERERYRAESARVCLDARKAAPDRESGRGSLVGVQNNSRLNTNVSPPPNQETRRDVYSRRRRIGAVSGHPKHSAAFDVHGKLLGVFLTRSKARDAILCAHFGQLSLPGI
jgi:hypothetical protein